MGDDSGIPYGICTYTFDSIALSAGLTQWYWKAGTLLF